MSRDPRSADRDVEAETIEADEEGQPSRPPPLFGASDDEEQPTRTFVGRKVFEEPEDWQGLYIGEPFVEATKPAPFAAVEGGEEEAETGADWRPPALDLGSDTDGTHAGFVCTEQPWPTVLDTQPLLFVGERDALDPCLLPLGETICLAEGSIIYEQGRPGQLLYLVDSGEVALHRERGAPQDLGPVGPGLFFGEVGAIAGMPSTTNAVAADWTVLRVVTRQKLARKQAAGSAEVEQFVGTLRGFYLETALALCPIFADADLETRWQVASESPRRTFHPGETLVGEGEAGELYLIVVGVARVVRATDDGEQWLGFLGSGDVVGELAVSPVAVRADTTVSALVISREALLELPEACRARLRAHIAAVKRCLRDG